VEGRSERRCKSDELSRDVAMAAGPKAGWRAAGCDEEESGDDGR
jgi:hypothetical protein